jgi:hypothetical protein
MRITSAGNVGIGTSSPAYKLDVAGEGKVTGKFRVGGAVMLAELGTGVLMFGSEGGNQTAIYSANSEVIRINTAGLVGIGTTSPNAKTQIFTDRYNDSLTFNATAGFIIGGSIRQLSINTDDTSPYNISLQAKTNGNAAANIILNSLGGNVGIGTTSPNAILDVNGDALINSLTVGLGGGNIYTNTALGNSALQFNTTGDNNIAIGTVALADNSSGSRNIAIGNSSLTVNFGGDDNISIGHGANANNSNLNGNTVIGGYLNSNPSGSNISSDNNLIIGQYNPDFGGVQVPHIYAPDKILCPNDDTLTDVLLVDWEIYTAVFMEYSIFNSDGDQFRAGTFTVAFKGTGTPVEKDNQTVVWNNTTEDAAFVTNYSGSGSVAAIQLRNNDTDNYYIRFTSRLLMR